MMQTDWNTVSTLKRRGSGNDEDEGDHSSGLLLEAAAVLLLLLLFLGLTAWASADVNIAPTIGFDPLAWSTFTA
jgi:hypothetical protein